MALLVVAWDFVLDWQLRCPATAALPRLLICDRVYPAFGVAWCLSCGGLATALPNDGGVAASPTC
ncbi:MAG: hypothetical protein ACYTXY_29230 [Nostoc sp.]